VQHFHDGDDAPELRSGVPPETTCYNIYKVAPRRGAKGRHHPTSPRRHIMRARRRERSEAKVKIDVLDRAMPRDPLSIAPEAVA